MVPSAFVMLDTMPLTANGKVDRRALPVPDTRASTNSQDFVAPRTPTEKTLAAIWTEVLRRDGVGIHQDFFALGGHSLLATQVISRIRTTLSLELPLRASFEHRTIAELAKAIDETSGGPVFATEQKIAPAARAAFRAKRSSL
jgi:acyl carrier protein